VFLVICVGDLPHLIKQVGGNVAVGKMAYNLRDLPSLLCKKKHRLCWNMISLIYYSNHQFESIAYHKISTGIEYAVIIFFVQRKPYMLVLTIFKSIYSKL